MPWKRLFVADVAFTSHTKEIAGTVISAVATITGSQEQVLWHLQALSYGIGILAGTATLWSIFHKRRRNRSGG